MPFSAHFWRATGWKIRSGYFRFLWFLVRRAYLAPESLLFVLAFAISLPAFTNFLGKPMEPWLTSFLRTLPSWFASHTGTFVNPMRALTGLQPQQLFPLWLAAFGLYASRRFAASQLGPKLLERFNGNSMYASRRLAYLEQFMWSAGDRHLLIQYECELPYRIEAASRAPDADRSVGISQVLGFVVELQHYHLRGLVDRATVMSLLRDRFSWFIWFFRQLADEIKDSQLTLVQKKVLHQSAKIPLPFVYRPHCLRWLEIQCGLEAFGRDVTYGLKYGTEDQVKPVPIDRSLVQGLQRFEDMDEYVVLLDSNMFPAGPSDCMFARRNHRRRSRWTFDEAGTGGFIRLRMKTEGWRHYAMLDTGVPRPTTFIRFVTYLSYDEGREWYSRLRWQGAIPLSEDDPYKRPDG